MLFLYLIADKAKAEGKAPGLNMGSCLPIATGIVTMKQKFREVVVFRGVNQRNELILIFSNPLTDSWTALQSVQGSHLCIVAYGDAGVIFPKETGMKH